MHPYPHTYAVTAAAQAEGNVELSADGVDSIVSAGPVEFDGPGDQWSPESLLVAAVADCFVLSFRAIARASKLEWSALSCDVDGILDKAERVTRFTGFKVHARLEIPAGVDEEKATRLLERAERACLVTNSLIAESELATEVVVNA